MKKEIRTLAIFVFLIFTWSCNRPECNNTNPVFDQFSPESKEYKEELVNQLGKIDNSKLRYWFDEYQDIDKQEYIRVFIQGDGLCAKAVLAVKQWDDIRSIRQTKGKGYRGAELKKLRFTIVQDSVKTDLIYSGVDAIID